MQTRRLRRPLTRPSRFVRPLQCDTISPRRKAQRFDNVPGKIYKNSSISGFTFNFPEVHHDQARIRKTNGFCPRTSARPSKNTSSDFKEEVPVHLFVKPWQERPVRRFRAESHEGPGSPDRQGFTCICTRTMTRPTANTQWSVSRPCSSLPTKYSIRFTGAPAGEEGQAFLHALMMVSTGSSFLSEQEQGAELAGLKEKNASGQGFCQPDLPVLSRAVRQRHQGRRRATGHGRRRMHRDRREPRVRRGVFRGLHSAYRLRTSCFPPLGMNPNWPSCPSS